MLLDDKTIKKIDKRLLKSAKNQHCIQILNFIGNKAISMKIDKKKIT